MYMLAVGNIIFICNPTYNAKAFLQAYSN